MFFLNSIINGGAVNAVKNVVHGVTKVAIATAGNVVGGVVGVKGLGTNLVSAADSYLTPNAMNSSVTGSAPTLASSNLAYVMPASATTSNPLSSTGTILGIPSLYIFIGGGLLLVVLLFSGRRK